MHTLARPMGPLFVQSLRINVQAQAAGRGKGSSFKKSGGGSGRGGGRDSGGGIPPWKRYTKKTLGRQAEATLESVWMRTQWPSDDTVASLWNLHRLRRDQVLTWFQDKRKKERGSGGGSKASSGSSSNSDMDTIAGPKTDWDAEWDPLEAEEDDDEEEEEVEIEM